MIIEWNISKKRGNFRPILTYTIVLEDFERDLAMPNIVQQSTIPQPPDSWSASCLPDKCERAEKECSTYQIYTPDHKTGEVTGKCILPWREEGVYPEIEESFILLREEFESVLKAAYESQPLEINGKLELSTETRKHIAAGLISQRFLEAAGF
ncbi:hypothetical protein [Maridesulfovibrio hydrothermalis]|uniref:Uncharacterized protein n=1 Tax=Maridesulfovibrio hydrothermalis AM13 = DSM 14728 TaxID=1121451 RepID=L0RFD9_9BACT|nr:hypothetical protein [Maridesulfovibrio hydrothermalis]CCO24922.1 conserved protein of unknown function [Maridesulfovibrio hydrothermalis AM13 = DSM 14728]